MLFDMVNSGGLAQGEIDEESEAPVLPERLDNYEKHRRTEVVATSRE